MRLLIVSDLHYRLPQFDWLKAAVRDPQLAIDLLVVAGDMLDIRSAVPLSAQAVAVSAELRTLSTSVPVVAASGNHDLDGRDAAAEKAARWLDRARTDRVHVDGESIEVEDSLFTITKWWDGPVGRTEVEARFAADAQRAKSRWVWVYHAPPTASPLAWDGRREYGDAALAEWLPRFAPDFVLSGHIHQAPFVPEGGWAQRIGRTWVFNPGQQHGPVPCRILLDLDKGTAEWFAATGNELLDLT